MSIISHLEEVKKRKNFEDIDILKRINDIFYSKQIKSFHLPDPGEPVILLLSGGLDSLGLWFLLTHKYKLHVHPVVFYSNNLIKTGQWKAILYMTDLIGKRFPNQFYKPHKVKISKSFSYKESNLNEKEMMSLIVRNLSTTDIAGTKAVVTNNPTRLFDYLSKTIGIIHKLRFQENVNIKSIFIGFVPEDGEISRESTLSVIRSMNLTLNLIFGDYDYRLFAPLDKRNGFFYKKSELVRYATENGVDLERAWSCIKPGAVHCGTCPSCRLRKRAFIQAGLADKTVYKHFLRRISSISQALMRKSIVNMRKNLTAPISIKQNIHLLEMQLYINKEVIWNDVDKKVYRFHKISGLLDSLNEVGGFIWKEIGDHPFITIKKLYTQVEKKFVAHHKTKSNMIIEDLTTFIAEAIRERYLDYK